MTPKEIFEETGEDVFAPFEAPFNEWGKLRYENRQISSCDVDLWINEFHKWFTVEYEIAKDLFDAYDNYKESVNTPYENRVETLVVGEDIPATLGASNDQYLSDRRKSITESISSFGAMRMKQAGLRLDNPRQALLNRMDSWFRVIHCT